MQAYNKKEETAKGLKDFIDKWLEQGKITKEEYDVLNSYIEIQIKKLLSKEKEETVAEKQSKEEISKKEDNLVLSQEDKKEQFHSRIQVEQKELKYIPIYKGKFNELPPKRVTKAKERE